MLKILLTILCVFVAISFVVKYSTFFIIIALIFLSFYIFQKVRKHRIPEKEYSNLPCYSYIVLDIETTGFSRKDDRIIEIAADLYKGGKLVDRFHSYINPGFHIPATITQLTGIRDADVENAPTIMQIRQNFTLFIEKYPLVGHNISSFDVPFINEQMGIKLKNRQFDTLQISKKVFPDLPSYKLTFLDQALHLGGVEHHRASNDILVNNALFLACYNPKNYQHFLADKKALWEIPIEDRRYLHSKVDIHSITPTDPNSIPNTGLTGKLICFTGEISIPRQQAYQMAVDAGAILKNRVSKKLDYLVVGEQDVRLVGETGMSNAQHYAASLISQGHKKLHVINEAEFFNLLTEIP